MKAFVEKHLRIYEHEFSGFMWTAVLFFFLFLFTALFRNYVDTAFLKRYGVEHLPLMLVINSILTFAILEALDRLGRRYGDQTLLSGFLLAYCILVTLLYILVRRSAGLPYPVLFQLLYLQDSVLLVYLWNIAGDLFDARQGRRIFPLLTAAQVTGAALGSFLTPPFSRWFGGDFTLVIYSAACLLAALYLARPAKTSRSVGIVPVGLRSSRETWRRIPSLVKKFPMIRYLIVLGVLPNVLLPIFTYQFSVIANSAFGSEASLISFLGFFRGATTLLILVVLLWVGSIYRELGLVRSSFLQPLNFSLLFGALIIWFNIAVASIAQFSVLLMQRAVAGPLNKILFNLVPMEARSWSRVFVRGTAVKFGMMLGAFLVLGLKPLMAPRYMALAALVIAIYWLLETRFFARKFKWALKQVIVEGQVDFDRIEADCVTGPAGTSVEIQAFHESRQDLVLEPETLKGVTMDPGEALKLLEGEDPASKIMAAQSLAESGDARAVVPLISMLEGDNESHKAAVAALLSCGQTTHSFLEAILIEQPLRVQRGILEVLRLSGRRNVEILPFVGKLLEEAYENLISLRELEGIITPPVDMLKSRLRERNEELLSLCFHALWINHADMRLMYEALKSSELSTAVELVEASLDPVFSRYLIPLIDNISLDERIRRGREVLPLMRNETLEKVLVGLGFNHDGTTRMLTAYAIGEAFAEERFLPILDALSKDKEKDVMEAAQFARQRSSNKGAEIPETLDRINRLREFLIFDGMGIRELQAIGSVAAVEAYRPGQIIIQEGEPDVSLYLVVKGRIAVFRKYETPQQKEERNLGPGSFTGELRLFTELPSSATLVAAEATEVYVIRRCHFQEIMKIYPQIGANLCLFFALKIVAMRPEEELE
ncbi:MAG: cyclic nucleotide-binding domain-containing protein [Desulfobacteraceae bacterium]|nr:MAG: cyclic nucleotide-binding domain-containing protein [Desulfobacteraceae bacterium]